MWNGTMFVDLDWPLNASSLLSASAELLVSQLVHGLTPSKLPFPTDLLRCPYNYNSVCSAMRHCQSSSPASVDKVPNLYPENLDSMPAVNWVSHLLALRREAGLITLRASCGAVYCNWSCLWVCVWVCLFVDGSVTTITRNCMHRSSPNWVW